MHAMKRSIVALKRDNSNFIVPKFSECLFDLLNKKDNLATVNWYFENNKFILKECEHGYELKHSPECPIKLISKTDSGKSEIAQIEANLGEDNNISLATSVVLESADNHILLTKRASKLKASPNVWVTPGGFVECGETIFEAGIREVMEETGLDISDKNLDVLGLWENTYPLLLGIGLPKTHVLIVYTHALMDESYENLYSKIIPNSNEVASYCWLSKSIIEKLFNCQEVSNAFGQQFTVENEKLISKSLDYSSMFNMWLWSQPQPYSGVNFALRKWVQKIVKEKKSSKF